MENKQSKPFLYTPVCHLLVFCAQIGYKPLTRTLWKHGIFSSGVYFLEIESFLPLFRRLSYCNTRESLGEFESR